MKENVDKLINIQQSYLRFIERNNDKSKTWRRKKCVGLAKKIAKHRDNYTCQKCMKRVQGVNCQGSHVISEGRNKKLSCDPLNIKVLCYRCHKRFWHLEPTLSGEWFKKKFKKRRQYLEEENRKTDGSTPKQHFIDKYIELSEIVKSIDNKKISQS